MTAQIMRINPGGLTLDSLRSLAAGPSPGSEPDSSGAALTISGPAVALSRESWPAIEQGAAAVADVLRSGKTVYGINTGFGSLVSHRISSDQVADLQRRLVRSHATGVGAPLDDRTVRLIMVLKIASLARGYSGVRPVVIQRLLDLLNAGITPIIPEQGSVGASGDLAPLAHLALTLIGEGTVRYRGAVVDSATALSSEGLSPVELGAKEGLAVLNGTQVSTALALRGLFAIEAVFEAALLAGAMTVDATLGSDTPFDPRIQSIRGHQGQIDVAAALRSLMQGSEIRSSHLECGRVQDPYSLRCQPQVMGACLDQMRYAAGILLREANGVSDNPLVFADPGGLPDILSGGNFHAEPVALAADALAVAVAEIGAIAERRIALITDARMSDLPPFLVAEPGLNSGFMIAHVTAAALAAENKMLSHPASVDSLPTSANQEDHVSMATHGSARLQRMATNAASIVAIELLAAAQGLDFRKPLKTSPALALVHDAVREISEFVGEDRVLSGEISALRDRVLESRLYPSFPDFLT